MPDFTEKSEEWLARWRAILVSSQRSIENERSAYNNPDKAYQYYTRRIRAIDAERRRREKGEHAPHLEA